MTRLPRKMKICISFHFFYFCIYIVSSEFNCEALHGPKTLHVFLSTTEKQCIMEHIIFFWEN